MTKKEIENIKTQYQGGIPDKYMEHPWVIESAKQNNFANGGGYIGRWQERTEQRDRCLVRELELLAIGDDFIVLFLITRFGRWYAESLSSLPKKYGFDSEKFLYQIGSMVKEKIIIGGKLNPKMNPYP